MSAKDRAVEIFNQHIALAATDCRLFRKTVMDQLKAETGCSQAAAATHYNTAKKAAPIVKGLGRSTPARTARKTPTGKAIDTVPDNECFSVMELVQGESGMSVGRYQAFLLQGDASEKFDEKVEAWPGKTWVMIQGLGPNSGDNFKLSAGEKEIKRYAPQKEEITA
jgi:hypothetical protein